MKALSLLLLLTACTPAVECVYSEYGRETKSPCYGRQADQYITPVGLAQYDASEYTITDIKLPRYSDVKALCAGKDGCIEIDRANKTAKIYRVYGAERVLAHEIDHITHGDYHIVLDQ